MNIFNSNSIFFKILEGFIIISVGIIIAELLVRFLKKFIRRNEIDRIIHKSAISLFLVIIRWGIYILFLNLTLMKLNLEQLNNWIIPILMIIPSLVGALILIIIGFFLALYLRDIIEDSKIEEAKLLSRIIFYFILYIFTIFAFKTAMINQDKLTTNIIIIILTAISAIGTAFHYIKKKNIV
ncbi:MAG: hypothetical protein QW117_01965 [Candidatus Pacearchaeota archaeon]